MTGNHGILGLSAVEHVVGGSKRRSRPLCCDSDWNFDECVNRCGLSRDGAHETVGCGNVCYNRGMISGTLYSSCICTYETYGSCCNYGKVQICGITLSTLYAVHVLNNIVVQELNFVC